MAWPKIRGMGETRPKIHGSKPDVAAFTPDRSGVGLRWVGIPKAFARGQRPADGVDADELEG